MKKTLKNVMACISAVAALTVNILSVSATTLDETIPTISGAHLIEDAQYYILDDKGMMQNDDYYEREGYKILLVNGTAMQGLKLAVPNYNGFSFVLNDNVDVGEADKRIRELFEECYALYPENSPYPVSANEMKQPDYYYRSIGSKTIDGKIVYSTSFTIIPLPNENDKRIEEAKLYVEDFINKLNEENLITAYYDFGEVYEVSSYMHIDDILYPKNADIEVIENYFKENNIACKMVKNDNGAYKFEFEEEADLAKQFSLAADIYEATSINICSIGQLETLPTTMFGENALKEIVTSFPTIAGDLDLDDKQGMSDIVFLTKYTASPELYPITDATALANADINQDGKIDSLDTNILIEMTLGSFESAV